MGRQFENRLQKLEKLVIEDYGKERVIDRLIPFSQPDGQVIEDITSKLFRVIFPGYFYDRSLRIYNLKNSISNLIEDIAYHLSSQIAVAVKGSSI